MLLPLATAATNPAGPPRGSARPLDGAEWAGGREVSSGAAEVLPSRRLRVVVLAGGGD